MRYSSILLALPALSVAEEQVPLVDKLKGWFNKAQAYVPTNVPSIPSIIPSVVDAGASKVAEAVVYPLNLTNWKDVLSPSARGAQSSGPEEVLVFITGGNTTCYGLCGNATTAWNKAVGQLAASPSAPKLASIDCDAEQILCNMWSAGPPAIYHMLLPKPLVDQTKPATTVRYIHLNRTSVTSSDITELSTKEKYKDTAPYEGYFHPFDSVLAQYGITLPLAYVFWGFAKMPSWLPMILISFISRSFMGRGRTAPRGGPPAAGAPGTAPAS